MLTYPPPDVFTAAATLVSRLGLVEHPRDPLVFRSETCQWGLTIEVLLESRETGAVDRAIVFGGDELIWREGRIVWAFLAEGVQYAWVVVPPPEWEGERWEFDARLARRVDEASDGALALAASRGKYLGEKASRLLSWCHDGVDGQGGMRK